MTQNNRLAVAVILARKHWEAIMHVIEAEYQSRGKDWLQWGNYVKQSIQSNSSRTASADDLALVTLTEDSWQTVNGLLEANCRTRNQEWVTWAGRMVKEIQSAIESARVLSRPGKATGETEPLEAAHATEEIKPVPEAMPAPETETIGQAIADLRNSDQREAATRKLIKIGAPVVEPLLGSLQAGEKFETKMAIREILSQMGSPAVDALQAAFETTEVIEVARLAAEALGKIGDARAVVPLAKQFIKASGIPTFDPFMLAKAQFAARALGKIRDERAVGAFMQILNDNRSHEILRGAAIQALGELRAVKATEILTSIFHQGQPNLGRQAAEALGRIGGDQIMDLLISALKNGNADIRVNAVSGLKTTADRRAVEPLISALKDRGWLVRNEAIRSLGALGDKRAVEPLMAVLDDPMFDVKWSAVMELGGFKDARALPKLILALRDPIAAIRRSAAKSLGQIGDPEAVEALIEALESPTDMDLMNGSQEAAAEALGAIGDVRAVPVLIRVLQHPHRRVQEKAAQALKKIGTPEALAALRH
jgi:HEAT repeat protein